MACGAVVRLQHLQTRLFLHSHKFSSPLSGNQEVSCFGDGSVGDSGIPTYSSQSALAISYIIVHVHVNRVYIVVWVLWTFAVSLNIAFAVV